MDPDGGVQQELGFCMMLILFLNMPDENIFTCFLHILYVVFTKVYMSNFIGDFGKVNCQCLRFRLRLEICDSALVLFPVTVVNALMEATQGSAAYLVPNSRFWAIIEGREVAGTWKSWAHYSIHSREQGRMN